MAHRWTIRWGETVTGRLLGTIEPISIRWVDGVPLRSLGSLQVICQLTQNTVAKLRGIAEGGWLFSLIAEYAGQAVIGGPVVAARVSAARDTVEIGCGLWPLVLAKRAVVRPGYENTPTDPAASLAYVGSLPWIAHELISDALVGTMSALPWVLETPSAGGAHERNYAATDVAAVLERLQQLTEVDDGPDVHFQPRTYPESNTFDVLVRIGEPELRQAGGDLVWTQGGNMRGWPALDIDHSQRSLRSYVPGMPQPGPTDAETVTPVGVYGDLFTADQRLPLLEAMDRDHGSTEIPTTVEAQARAHQQTFANPTTDWAVSVYADRAPVLGRWRPGDWAQFRTASDDMWLGARDERRRIMGVSGDLSDTVTLTLSNPVPPPIDISPGPGSHPGPSTFPGPNLYPGM